MLWRNLALQLLLHWLVLVHNVYAAPEDDMYTSEDAIAQLSIGEFKVILKPTPEKLTDVELIIVPTIERIVRDKLEHIYNESFEYFYVASVKSVQFQDGSDRRLTYSRHLETESSMTAVSFVGGVVAFDEVPMDNINTLIQAALDSDLALELSKNGGPWASIEHCHFISLVSSENPQEPSAAPSLPPYQVSAGTGDIDYLSDNDDNQRLGLIAGGFMGVAFVVMGLISLVRRSRRQEVMGTLNVSEEKNVRIEESNSPNKNGDDDGVSESGYRSEMAHYAPGELLDSISTGPSVTSEWTLQTSDDTKISGATSLQGLRASSVAWASAETFERDRQITLQKDMLQSEWTTLTNRRGARPSSPFSTQPEPQSYLRPSSDTPSSPKLSFEQAYEGQGEEIYLMPPTRAASSRTGELI